MHPFIDPDLGLGRGERRAIMEGARKRWMAVPMNSVKYTLISAATFIPFLLAPDLFERLLAGSHWYDTVIRASLFTAGLLVVLTVFLRHGFAPYVYKEMRARGHNVCQRCGYSQAELPADVTRCPECGAARATVQPP